MTFSYGYSQIAQVMKPSPIRELFKLIQRPGMISFAGGLPDPAIFPIDEFAQCSSVLREQGKTVLQYGATEGFKPLVDEVCSRMEAPLGRPIKPEELIITSGSQQVMDMLAKVLIDPGDVIIVEAPTYPGALHTFRNAGARFALIPCDADGMIVDSLPEVIANAQLITGRKPKLIYTIINFSNPSGACVSAARRETLADIAQSHGIPVLEDDPYGPLRYRGESIPTLFSMGSGGIIFASSFSKILAPGVRVAWAVGDAEIIRKMAIAKQGMDLCTSVVAQALTAEYCRRGFLDSHLNKICAHYAGKRDAMSQAFRAELPAGAVTGADPDGGFFFWLRLATGDGTTLFHHALEEGVAFLPGATCFPDTHEIVGQTFDGSPYLRCCFTFAQGEEVVAGARRLARAIERLKT